MVSVTKNRGISRESVRLFTGIRQTCLPGSLGFAELRVRDTNVGDTNWYYYGDPLTTTLASAVNVDWMGPCRWMQDEAANT